MCFVHDMWQLASSLFLIILHIKAFSNREVKILTAILAHMYVVIIFETPLMTINIVIVVGGQHRTQYLWTVEKISI